jgi:hypothetical protein
MPNPAIQERDTRNGMDISGRLATQQSVTLGRMFGRLARRDGRGILIEFVMIVVGINIALWFEGWFEEQGERKVERQYLEGLRDDLRDDIGNLDKLIEWNEQKTENLANIIPRLDELPDASGEVQAESLFEPSGYQFFQPSDFTFLSMRESGDFRLLSDEAIKQGILRLNRQYTFIATLEKNFLQALDDGYARLLMTGFDVMESRITDPALIERQDFRNFFPFAYQDTSTRVVMYRRAREQAATLLDLIEEQLRS